MCVNEIQDKDVRMNRTEYMCVNDIPDNDRVIMKGRNTCV